MTISPNFKLLQQTAISITKVLTVRSDNRVNKEKVKNQVKDLVLFFRIIGYQITRKVGSYENTFEGYI